MLFNVKFPAYILPALSSLMIMLSTFFVQASQSLLLSPPHMVHLKEDIQSGYETKDCQDFILKLPEDFIHGTLSVPENWLAPDGEKIKIFFHGIIENNDHSPIIFFNGGPGSSSHSSLSEKRLNKVRDLKRSFIFIDQRGTGCSSPYPLLESGEIKRLTHFSSTEIAKDAEEVRKKLFPGKKAIAFGHSFGAKAALKYVELFPSSLKKVVFGGDSALSSPLNKDSANHRSTLSIKKEFKYTENKAISSLREGDLETYRKLEFLIHNIPYNYCISGQNNEIQICGKELLVPFDIYIRNQEYHGYLKDWIDEIVPVDSIDYVGLHRFIDEWTWPGMNPSRLIVRAQDYRITSTASKRRKCEYVRKNHSIASILHGCVLADFYDYLEEKMGRPLQGHGVVWSDICQSIKKYPSLKIINFIGLTDGSIGRQGDNGESELIVNKLTPDDVCKGHQRANIYSLYVRGGHTSSLYVDQVWQELL